jgi:hypothetical protein
MTVVQEFADSALRTAWLRRACLGIVAVCSLQLTGCAALMVGWGADSIYAAAFRTTIIDISKLKGEERERLQAVEILSADAATPRVSKGPVKGFACKLLGLDGWHWRPTPSEVNGKTPEATAVTQMKVKAVLLGGNAVVLKSCTHGDAWDWGNDCFDTWTCIGEAVSQ